MCSFLLKKRYVANATPGKRPVIDIVTEHNKMGNPIFRSSFQFFFYVCFF
jgi:hypothetical protein